MKSLMGSLLTTLLATSAVTPAAEVDSARLSPAVSREIDAIVAHALTAGPVPGISVAVERDRQIVYQKGFGYADLENRVPVTKDTVFPIGSITKTMTGLAIAQLVAAGKVDLEAAAGRYLPDLPEPARSAKIRFLLEHTSGVVNYTEIPGFPATSQAPISRQDVLHWFASRPLLFAPGTRWSYTNSGQYLLGLVIEAVSGETFEAYLQRHLFTPFNMPHSSLAGWAPLVDNRAHGYMRGASGIVNAPRFDPLLPFSAGAVLSTSGDLINYRRGVFGDDRFSAAIRAELLRRDKLPDGLELPYTRGCLVISELAGHRRLGHPGEVFGFEAQYSYFPDDRLTIAVLTNTQSSAIAPASIELKIARAVLGIAAPRIEDRPLDASHAEGYAGDYAVTDMRFGFDSVGFLYQQGALQLVFGGVGSGAPGIALRYQGGGSFVSSLDDEQRVEFSPGEKSEQMTIYLYGSALKLTRVKP